MAVSAASAAATGAAALFAYWAYEAAFQSVVAARETVTETRRQANIAGDALIANTRPWIQATQIRITHVEIGGERISVGIHLVLKNTGTSPALAVQVRPELLTDYVDPAPWPAARSVCARAKERRGSPFDTALFPGEEKPVAPTDTLFGASLANFRQGREAGVRFRYLNEFDATGVAAAEATRADRNRPMKLPLTLIGCVTYKARGTEEIFGTSFGLELWRGDRSNPHGNREGFEMEEPRLVPLSDVVEKPLPYGITAD